MPPKHAATESLPSQPAKKRQASEREDESLDQPQKLVALATDGDVLVIVGTGEDKLGIKVSGAILSHASEVFRRMLSSNFVEASSRVITMKEDDPNAVLEFLKVLHFDFSGVKKWNGREMTLVVEMASMRRCIDVFKPHILPTLTEIIEALARATRNPVVDEGNAMSCLKEKEFTLQHVMEIAAGLDLPDLFSNAVKMGIVHFADFGARESLGAGWSSMLEGDGTNNFYGLSYS